MQLKKLIHNLLTVCFICYMILLVYFLFFSERYGRTEPYSTYQYNFTFFREISRYIEYRDKIGDEYFLINVAGNVGAFVPCGFLVPVIYREQRGEKTYRGHYLRAFFFASFLGFLFSFCVETVQLVTKVGCFDVDDLMLNTIGVMCGYVIYYICKRMIGFWSCH